MPIMLGRAAILDVIDRAEAELGSGLN